MSPERLSFLRAVVFVAATAGTLMLGCGPTNKTCNPTECSSGCCDLNGQCQPGAAPTACGAFGNLCQVCPADNVCTGGTCIPFASTSPGKDGGGNNGDAGMGDGGMDDGGMGDGGMGDGGTGDGGMGDGGQNDGGMDAGCRVNGQGCTSSGQCCSSYCSQTEGICTNTPPQDSGPWYGENCSTPDSTLTFTQISTTQFQAVASDTLTGYVHESTGTCGGSGPDRVYVFNTGDEFDVTVSLQSSGTLAPVAYVRSATCTSGELTCGNSVAGGTATLQYSKLAPGTYYLWVDSANSTGGSYTLTITASVPPASQPGDVCTSPVSLSFSGNTASTSGDTTGLANDISTTSSGCSSATGPDVFYTIFNPGTATLTATVTPLSGSYRPAVYFRQSCTSSTLTCSVASSSGASATATLNNAAAGTYYIVVDGSTSTSGPYFLDITRTPSTSTATGESCSDPIPLSFTGSTTQTATASGTTSTALNNHNHSCASGTTVTAPDRVYTFTTSTTKTLTATVTPSPGWDVGISVNASPCSSGTEYACIDNSASGAETISATLPAGTYYIWIDGYDSSSSGSYSLSVTLQ